MCLAGNFGACDGEAVVLILDLVGQGMPLGLEQWYTQNDYAELQTSNDVLRANNARLARQLQTTKRDFEKLQANKAALATETDELWKTLRNFMKENKKEDAALEEKNKILQAQNTTATEKTKRLTTLSLIHI